ncbi:AbrB/MazE/SpoVT family DNA-binding domain-containing protein [Microbacterium sp. A204]|uniref:AbrB/MazE/SpoVT family DNA-binding domain-containing protein n=1 Tax=Microbacterium sp. A204 TaxID=3457321 RepID=UPI003FCFD5DA
MAKVGVPDGRWVSTVRLGPKSQIVIPKEVREMFSLGPGDTLLLMADRERGIALVDPEVYAEVMDNVLGADHRPDGGSE